MSRLYLLSALFVGLVGALSLTHLEGLAAATPVFLGCAVLSLLLLAWPATEKAR